MSKELRFKSPVVGFDSRLENELAHGLARFPVSTDDEAQPVIGRSNPLNGYVRTLTPEGGIFICYRDQDRSAFLMSLRLVALLAATYTGGWLILVVSNLSALNCVVALGVLMTITIFFVMRKIVVHHTVEIRSDCMIVDGEDVFYAEDIGDNWPELQTNGEDEDADRMVISGICGTRFIEYMTVNRLDKNDRTPEVLAADLQAAMEQLWGRREVTFAAFL
jgi:hypothetical protein